MKEILELGKAFQEKLPVSFLNKYFEATFCSEARGYRSINRENGCQRPQKQKSI